MMTNPARDDRPDTTAATYPDGSLKMGWAVAVSMATVQDYADDQTAGKADTSEVEIP